MNDMSEFQQRAASVALSRMLNGKHFSISTLEEIATMMGRESAIGGKDRAALRSMHCVDYAEMGPELASMVREKCCELLGLPPIIIEAAAEAKAQAQSPTRREGAKPPSLLQLVFGTGRV